MRKLPLLAIVGLVALGGASVARSTGTDAEPGTAVKAGDVRNAYGFYSLVFYFAPEPKVPADEAARELIRELFPDVPVVTSAENSPPPPFIGIDSESAPLKNYPVPGAEYFKYAGRGLSADDIAAVQRTRLALRVILVAPKQDIWTPARRFTELGLRLATKTGAFIWDSATRECFTPTEWKSRRLDRWKGTIPIMGDHFTIHLYRVAETNYTRAITLGMEKFALPDLVIQELLASDGRSGGNLINVTAQLLAENPTVKDPAAFRLKLADLRNESFRESQRANLLKGAREEATLALIAGRRDEGDPNNKLFELDFRHGEGRSADERRQAIFTRIWGASDSLVSVRHDDAILAASQRAKARLPALQAMFAKGLAAGEHLLLKAPFARDDDGNEWMWVEVMNWPESGRVVGILQNDPYYIKKLRAGSRVVVKAEEVFDYIYYKADGSQEGNETGRLMQQQSEASKAGR